MYVLCFLYYEFYCVPCSSMKTRLRALNIWQIDRNTFEFALQIMTTYFVSLLKKDFVSISWSKSIDGENVIKVYPKINLSLNMVGLVFTFIEELTWIGGIFKVTHPWNLVNHVRRVCVRLTSKIRNLKLCVIKSPKHVKYNTYVFGNLVAG